MSRRDTIIVAVLVNAGLLIVLFASALKSNAPGEEFATAPAPTIQEALEPVVKKETPAMGGDEVDHAIRQFTQNAVAAHPAAQEVQVGVAPEPTSSGFADDLKAIAASEAPPASQVQNPAVHTLTAPVAPPARTAPEFVEVKVKKGDVLEKIARHHHSTVAEIMKTNKLTTSNLRIGQVLKVPVKSIRRADTSTISWSAPAQGSQSDGGAKFYTVAKGDSPWTIAVKNHLKVEDLLKLNNMNEDQARRLKPGDKIRIQ